MPYAPSTQPESVRQVLKRSCSLYRYAFTRAIPLALFLSLVAFIPRLLALVVGQDIFFGLPQWSPLRLWLILIEFTSLVFFTILLWRMRCVMYNMHESIKDDLVVTLKKLPRIIGAAVIENGIVMSLFLMIIGIVYVLRDQNLFADSKNLPFFLVIIPLYLQLCVNIFIFVLLMFYLPLILNENKHIFEALGKSAALVWGNWWRTFVTQLIPWAIYLLMLLFIRNTLGLNIHLYFLPMVHLSVAATCVHILLFTLFLPWFAATMLVQLQDLEIRKAL
jgi:hypothetical protein